MIRQFIAWRLGKHRVENVTRVLRLEAERPDQDRQMRRYLNALADIVEGTR